MGFIKNLYGLLRGGKTEYELKVEQTLIDVQKELELKTKEISELVAENDKLKNSLVPVESKEEEYWNNKWSRSIIRYKTQGKYYRDVRTLINYPSYIAQEIVSKNNLKKDTEEKTILALIEWCSKNIYYQFDDKNYGSPEWWADSDIILQKFIDDCDGKACAFKTLALTCDIPDYKIHIVAGWVKDPKNLTTSVGHAYPTYIFENKEYPCDPTYYPDWKTPFNKRQTLKEDKRYNPIDKSIWWCFTKEFTFANRRTTI